MAWVGNRCPTDPHLPSPARSRRRRLAIRGRRLGCRCAAQSSALSPSRRPGFIIPRLPTSFSSDQSPRSRSGVVSGDRLGTSHNHPLHRRSRAVAGGHGQLLIRGRANSRLLAPAHTAELRPSPMITSGAVRTTPSSDRLSGEKGTPCERPFLRQQSRLAWR